jgi:TRAP-type C4-dicarboxylate transport system permease small subunit
MKELFMRVLLQAFGRVDACFAVLIKPVVIVLSLMIAGLMTYGVVMRSLFDHPVFGLEEYILMASMWLYMLGAVLASRDRTHLSADFIQVMTSNPKVIKAFQVISTLISLAMAILFSVWAFDLMVWSFNKGQVTTVHQLPWAASQCSLFVASVFLIFYLLRDVLKDISSSPSP